jgi:hypothetical protein
MSYQVHRGRYCPYLLPVDLWLGLAVLLTLLLRAMNNIDKKVLTPFDSLLLLQ